MPFKGSFGIPDTKDKSTAGARARYLAVWQNEWPHDDDYLRQLAKELPPRKSWAAIGGSRCQFLIEIMRESHEIPADKLPGQPPTLN